MNKEDGDVPKLGRRDEIVVILVRGYSTSGMIHRATSMHISLICVLVPN